MCNTWWQYSIHKIIITKTMQQHKKWREFGLFWLGSQWLVQIPLAWLLSIAAPLDLVTWFCSLCSSPWLDWQLHACGSPQLDSSYPLSPPQLGSLHLRSIGLDPSVLAWIGSIWLWIRLAHFSFQTHIGQNKANPLGRYPWILAWFVLILWICYLFKHNIQPNFVVTRNSNYQHMSSKKFL